MTKAIACSAASLACAIAVYYVPGPSLLELWFALATLGFAVAALYHVVGDDV